MLPNINLLYLGCSVLILLDRSYSGRFWTMYEAWLSFMTATNDGLLTAPVAEQRCKMRCLHGCPQSQQDVLREEWDSCSARSTYEKLSEPDVDVTNKSDKEMQLPKILAMDQMVIDIMAKRRAPPSSPASAAGSGAKAVKAATASPAAACSVTGLEELLSSLGLQENLAAAAEWCDSIGAESVDDLKDEDYAERLAAQLELKEIKAKRLVKAIKAYCSEK